MWDSLLKSLLGGNLKFPLLLPGVLAHSVRVVGGGPLPEEAVHPVHSGRGGAGPAVQVVVQGFVAPEEKMRRRFG